MRHHQDVGKSPETGEAGGELRVRLAADAASVPGARRFVTDGLLSWGMTDLVDDAALCVSELAGNAALHSGSTFMHIALRPLQDAVRLSVEDDGVTPVDAVHPRASFPGPDDDLDVLLLDDEPTTGRGLAIVSMLASDWGVESTDIGKRIWVDIDGTDTNEVRPPRGATSAPLGASAGDLPDGWGLVRLVGCPVQLSLRQDEHLDELVRELQLIGSEHASLRSQALARELEDLLSGPAHARHTGRRIAQQAAAEGRSEIDIEMAMPREFSAEVQKLDVAVKAADVLCDDMRLLTLASSDDLRALRAWMTEQIVEQVERGRPPVSWADWRATSSR
jgi:anti-sigma regulatory factor (Ser/Thr protein kinase)